MTNMICFSGNYNAVKVGFKDYMNQYFSEVAKRDGYIYDNTITFAEKEAKIDKLMKAEIFKLSGVNFSEDSMVSKEMWASNPMLKWASFAVVNSLIDMILPETIDKSQGIYTEIRNGAMGDNFSFEVESNDLFYISKAGRDQRTTEFQKQFTGITTVTPSNRNISVSVNFYKVLCGIESLAKFVMKAILSIETQISKEVYTMFASAMNSLPTTPVDGNLKVTGYSQSEAIRLAQTVSAFNHGAPAVFVGTQLALQNILPANTGARFMLDDEYVTLGYMKNAFGYDTMKLPQIADWKNPYKTLLDDKKIYVVSPSSQKIIKLCFEGATRSDNLAAQTSANLTEATTLNKSWGIGIATNAIAGVIELA